MYRRLRCGTALAVALAMSSQAAAEGIVRTFAVEPGGALVVDAEQAALDVRGGADSVRVAITRGDDDAAAIEDDFEIAFEHSGEELRIKAKRRDRSFTRWFPGEWHQRRLSITVAIPREFDAELRTSGGRVQVAELTGSVRARTSGGSIVFADIDGAVAGQTSGGSIRHSGTSAEADMVTSGGSIHLGKIEGGARIQTSGGRIAVDRVAGPVSAKTSGGSIEIGEALGTVDATTSGGGIRATLAGQPRNDSRLRTSGGSIAVSLGSEFALDVSAKTSGGRVDVDDMLAFHGDSSKNSINGTVNGGGPRLVLRTSGGSITLRQR